jgi:hypothetical protein
VSISIVVVGASVPGVVEVTVPTPEVVVSSVIVVVVTSSGEVVVVVCSGAVVVVVCSDAVVEVG